MKKKQCQAIAKSTQRQCLNKSIIGTDYCWVHYPRKGPLIFLFFGAFLSLLFQIIYDRSTESDEEKLIVELSDRLKPFEELAVANYPNKEKKDALDSLVNDFEKLKRDVQLEKELIKSLGAKLKVTFSGNWKESPATIMPISLGTPTPHYIELLCSKNENVVSIDLVATQLFSRKAIDENTVVFESIQEVNKGSFPLGKKIYELAGYDKIRVQMPLGHKAKNFEKGKITLNDLEIKFYINGKECQIVNNVRGLPFDVPVKKRYAIFDYNLGPLLFLMFLQGNK